MELLYKKEGCSGFELNSKCKRFSPSCTTHGVLPSEGGSPGKPAQPLSGTMSDASFLATTRLETAGNALIAPSICSCLRGKPPSDVAVRQRSGNSKRGGLLATATAREEFHSPRQIAILHHVPITRGP